MNFTPTHKKIPVILGNYEEFKMVEAAGIEPNQM